MPINFHPSIGGAAVSGRYIYLVGGYVIDTYDVDNRVFVSEVASDGALGEWRATEPFPIPRIGYGVVRHGDYLYLIGGTRSGTALDDVSSARIRDDGTLAPWQKNTPMPSARRGECTFAVVVR